MRTLIRQLKTSIYSGSRQIAAQALGRSGNLLAVKPLLTALTDPSLSVRKAAADALDQLGWKPEEAGLHAVHAIAAQKWEEVAKLGPSTVVPLIDLIVKCERSDGRSDVWSASLNWMEDVPRRKLELPDPLEMENVARRKLEEPMLISEVSKKARETLVSIGEPAVEILLTTLNRDSSRRQVAAEIMGEIADARAVDQLIMMLEDESSGVQAAAAEALGKIGDRRAVEPLITLLQDRHLARIAAEALREIGDPRYVDAYILLLDAKDHYTREKAVEVLGGSNDLRAVKPLIVLLKESTSLRSKVAGALVKLGWRPSSRSDQALLAVSLQKWGEVADLGEAAVEPLIAALRAFHGFTKDDEVAATIQALVNIGKAAIPSLITALNYKTGPSGSQHGSKAAATALGKIGDPEAVEPLIAILKGEWSNAQPAAAEALGEIGDRAAVEPLIAALERGTYAAAEALGRIGDPKAIAALEKIISATIKARYEKAISPLVSGMETPQLAMYEGALARLKEYIHFSAYAPPLVQPKSQFLLHIWTFLDEQRQEMHQRAIRRGQLVERGGKGPVPIEPGSEIDVLVTIKGFVIEPYRDKIYWDGEIANASFGVTVPENCARGKHIGHARILVSGIPRARLSFEIEVGKRTRSTEPLFTKEWRVRSILFVLVRRSVSLEMG